jgi:hypothetical protein
VNIDFSRPQIGIELELENFVFGPFFDEAPFRDAGATFAVVPDNRIGYDWVAEGAYMNKARHRSSGLAERFPTYICGMPGEWNTLSGNHAGMIVPEWPYGYADYFLRNLNDPTPHVQEVVDDDNLHARDMRRVVSGSMIGRYVSSVESISALECLETDFLVLARRGRSYSALETGLMASMIAVSELPTLVQGIETGESASIAMESGARGVIISSQSLSVELVAEVKNSLGG